LHRRLLGKAFRVPLHTDGEALPGQLYRLDHAVFRAAYDF
jgi:hypothetical protein